MPFYENHVRWENYSSVIRALGRYVPPGNQVGDRVCLCHRGASLFVWQTRSSQAFEGRIYLASVLCRLLQSPDQDLRRVLLNHVLYDIVSHITPTPQSTLLPLRYSNFRKTMAVYELNIDLHFNPCPISSFRDDKPFFNDLSPVDFDAFSTL